LIRQRWLRFFISLLFIAVGIGIALFLLGSIRSPLKRWLAMSIALISLLPWIAWETVFPPPIDLTAFSDTVDYEFRDPEYAEEFMELNPTDEANGT
jgi:hypothetical protein